MDPSASGSPGEPTRKPGPRRASVFAHSDELTIGFRLVFGICIGALAGHWVDRRLGLETPVGLMVGFALGAASGFKALFALAGPPEGRGKGRGGPSA
jgi:hypothetical protein